MLHKALIVYGKEMLMMRRDRRLTIGVTVTSLIVMPALMGFLGRMTTTPGEAFAPTAVLVTVASPFVDAVIQDDSTLFRIPTAAAESYPSPVTISGSPRTLLIQTDRTRTHRWEAARRIETALLDAKRAFARDRLRRLGISPDEIDPFEVQLLDTSSAGSRGTALLGTLVPYLVIVLLVANAIRAVYVAVGEKEKNTLGSLLVSQVPREAIVIGKNLAISTFAVIASLLLVTGMVLFANLGFTIAGDALGAVAFSLNLAQTAQLVINIGCLALVISSVVMVLGTLARTQREAGAYTAPLLFLAVFLAIFSFSDATFPWSVYAIPILGNAVAMKSTIIEGTAFPQLGVTLASNTAVFAVLVFVSVAMYRRETVLFRR
jgi:sodium transport system permease protein